MSSSTPDATERLSADELPAHTVDETPEQAPRPAGRDARVLAGLRAHARADQRERLPERYELLGELGRGGMAVVHRARDHELGREVAVKFVRLDLVDADVRARFRREARATAQLAHPHIVTLHDADADHLVMELLPGGSFADALAAPEPPPLDARVAIVEQACRGVQAAHDAGVTHRDLKPGNLLLDADGRAKVADFGLAHLAGDGGAMTVTGAILGTPAYMSPEQASAGAVGPPTDVYALGAILYECLTGSPPYRARSPLAVLERIANHDPVPPRQLADGVPRDLETIALVAMAREPARRYPSAAALADDLARWRRGEPVTARRPTLAYRLTRLAARRPALTAVSALALLAIAVTCALTVPPLLRARAAMALWRDVSVLSADAELHARLGETEQAHRRLDRAIARCRASDTPESRYFLGRLLVQRGQPAGALAAFDAALDADPDLGEARLARGLLRVADYEREVMRLHARYAGQPPGTDKAGPSGEALEARHATLRALRQAAIADLAAPVGRSPYFRDADARFGRAELARLRWRYDEAARAYRALLADEPLYTPAHLGLARQAFLHANYPDAVRHATAAIDRDRSLGAAYSLRGQARYWIARTAFDHRAARADLDRALALLTDDADRATVLMTRGPVRAAQGDYQGARADLDESLRLEPNAIAYNHRGRLHARDNDKPRAAADFDAALRLAPHYASALLNRALLGAGSFEAAKRDVDAALRHAVPGSQVARQARAFRNSLPD